MAPDMLISAYAAAGYDAVYLTDHDAVWPHDELEELRRRNPRLLVFPGLEKSLGRYGPQHLLILGANDPEYLAMDTEEQVLAKARAEGHLTILAHPYRYTGSDGMLRQGVLPDAIEHRSLNHDEQMGAAAKLTARTLGLPLVNAGDAHALFQVGWFWIETSRPVVRAGDIRGIVLAGEYANRCADAEPDGPAAPASGGEDQCGLGARAVVDF
jgi:predicted metal-dependent phosphoesterase TrpH